MIGMMIVPRFFVDNPIEDFFEIAGEDANHIMKSLRMKRDEMLILSHNEVDYHCKITNFSKNSVQVQLVSAQKCEAEPRLKVTLFQGIPKGDKMDLIVQKAVEVGVNAIVPVFTGRCVSRPDEKSLQKKVQRWQKIALEAAKQSGRGCVPRIFSALNLKDAVSFAKNSDEIILFYENDGESLSEAMKPNLNSVSVFVGPEGGFEASEVAEVKNSGGKVCSLGKRILRTETAAIVSVALAIYESERPK